jgi:hypothetical protein
VTSSLGTGKSITFFTVYIVHMFVLGVWQCSVTASSFRSRDALVSDEAKLVGEYVIAYPLMFWVVILIANPIMLWIVILIANPIMLWIVILIANPIMFWVVILIANQIIYKPYISLH